MVYEAYKTNIQERLGFTGEECRNFFREEEELPPVLVRDMLDAYDRLATELEATFRTQEARHDWMRTPKRYLGGRTPIDEINERGLTMVFATLEVLNSGVFI